MGDYKEDLRNRVLNSFNSLFENGEFLARILGAAQAESDFSSIDSDATLSFYKNMVQCHTLANLYNEHFYDTEIMEIAKNLESKMFDLGEHLSGIVACLNDFRQLLKNYIQSEKDIIQKKKK